MRALGNVLLSAIEKGDAEQLSLMRQGHEIALAQMTQNVRFLQWQQAQQAKKLASSLIELKGIRLKLGIMCTIGPANFVGLLSNLQAQYPGIELEIFDAGAPDLQERLLEGGLEAAIYCWPDQVDERLHYLPLFREQFFIVLGLRHHLATRNAVRVSDLNGERYLTASIASK